jgi:hypothetical protein
MMEIQEYGHEGRVTMYRTEILQITKLPITQIVRKELTLPDGTIKILLIVLSKYYFSTLFGSFLL